MRTVSYEKQNYFYLSYMNKKDVMKHKLPGVALVIIFLAIAQSCSHRYAATNRVYKKQAKEFAKLLRKYPLQ